MVRNPLATWQVVIVSHTQLKPKRSGAGEIGASASSDFRKA
jgi:hypothetical protein